MLSTIELNFAVILKIDHLTLIRVFTVALVVLEWSNIVSGRAMSKRSHPEKLMTDGTGLELVDDKAEPLENNKTIYATIESAQRLGARLDEHDMLGSGVTPDDEEETTRPHPPNESDFRRILKKALSTEELIEISKNLTDYQDNANQRGNLDDQRRTSSNQSPPDVIDDILKQVTKSPIDLLPDSLDLDDLTDLVENSNEPYEDPDAQNSSTQWLSPDEWESSGALDSIKEVSSLDDSGDVSGQLTDFFEPNYVANQSDNNFDNPAYTSDPARGLNHLSNSEDIGHVLNNMDESSGDIDDDQLEQLPNSEHLDENEDTFIISEENQTPKQIIDLDDYFDQLEQITSQVYNQATETHTVTSLIKETLESVGVVEFTTKRMHQTKETTSPLRVTPQLCYYCSGSTCEQPITNDESNSCWSFSGACWATYDINSSTMTRGCNATTKYGVCTLPGGRRANSRCEWCCTERRCNNGVFDERACQLIGVENGALSATARAMWLFIFAVIVLASWWW